MSVYYTLMAATLFPGLPSFPVSGIVTQDPDSNTASEVAGSTVISWSPASVSGGGASYTVSLDGVAVASTTDTTATLTGLDFNRTYSVSVEAQNVCNGPQLQGNVLVAASGDCTIECYLINNDHGVISTYSVVDVYIGNFTLDCAQQELLSASFTWIVVGDMINVRPTLTWIYINIIALGLHTTRQCSSASSHNAEATLQWSGSVRPHSF